MGNWHVVKGSAFNAFGLFFKRKLKISFWICEINAANVMTVAAAVTRFCSKITLRINIY